MGGRKASPIMRGALNKKKECEVEACRRIVDLSRLQTEQINNEWTLVVFFFKLL
jgi:hypothetical protein